jgi:hypothetical protein
MTTIISFGRKSSDETITQSMKLMKIRICGPRQVTDSMRSSKNSSYSMRFNLEKGFPRDSDLPTCEVCWIPKPGRPVLAGEVPAHAYSQTFFPHRKPNLDKLHRILGSLLFSFMKTSLN